MSGPVEARRTLAWWELLRDLFVARAPRLLETSAWFRRLITRWYGFEPNFIFLTHPRDVADIYATCPALGKLSALIPERLLLRLLSVSPCFVVATIQGNHGVRGLIVSTSLLPRDLISERSRTLKNAGRIVDFVRRLSRGRVYVGLAAWWPMVTDGGRAFDTWAPSGDRIIITSGHLATLASLYLATRTLGAISGRRLEDLQILVIGVGRMGGAVASLLNGKVRAIGLLDRNARRSTLMAERLLASPGSRVEAVVPPAEEAASAIARVLSEYDVSICTTSNLGYLVGDFADLERCIVLDDARPEAFPRGYNEAKRAAVCEGGLMKIPGVRVDSNFGFGGSENVFGCLAEAYVLALDDGRLLRPTRGEIDMANFQSFLDFCQATGIREGDFKAGERVIGADELRRVMGCWAVQAAAS